MTDFIKKYLTDRLINVGDNEERLTHLRGAAEQVATAFVENRILLLRYLRTVLVEKVDAQSPVFEDIRGTVVEAWPTFVSIEPDPQLPILHAVGWHAVSLATEKDQSLVDLVWYGSVNLLTLGKIDGNSHPAIEFINQQGIAVEANGCLEWNSVDLSTVKQIKVKNIDSSDSPVAMAAGLLKAVSGTDEAGAQLDGGNPNAVNSGAPWATFFAKTAANTIGSTIKAYGESIVKAVQSSFSDLNSKFGQLKRELTRSHQAQSRRTELLWLAESRYSPRAKSGYKELGNKEVIALIAIDVAEIAKGSSPQSVEYFLAEIVDRVVSAKSVKLTDVAKELAKSDLLDVIPTQLLEKPDGVARVGALEFVGELRSDAAKLSEFAGRTGLEKETAKSPGELGKWLYHEIKCAESVYGDFLWK